MIVLPNNMARYISALRIYISLQVLKYGLNAKHLERLRKIYIAEAFLNSETTQSVNIGKLVFNLLESVSAIKPDFKYRFKSTGNFLINKKLLIVLLLNLSRRKNFIEIESVNDYLTIKVIGKIKKSLSTVKTLKGLCLYEVKSNQTLIILPSKKTSQKSVPIESEWQNLFDSFSAFNIFFTRIL